MALPTSLMYGQKPSAVASRSTRSSIAPVNGSEFSGTQAQTLRLEIPTGIQGQYLNPAQTYLKFSLAAVHDAGITAPNGVRTDQSVYSIFDRLVISHNGVVIEQLDSYGTLANALLDFQCSASQLNNDLNIMIGSVAPDPTTGTVTGITLATGVDYWFNMPILSSLFTMLGDRYLPIGDIRNELRIELTLNPQGLLRTGGTVPYTYSIKNVELLLDIVELDPAVSSTIRKETLSANGAFRVPLTQWRCFNTVINSGSEIASAIIPAKMNSLKNLLVIQRDQVNMADQTKSKNERIGGASFKNYWFQIGSHMVPQKPVSHVYEAYAELQKSMHDLSLGQGDSILNRTTYLSKKFMIGLELESMSHRSDVLNSGMNSNSLNIYFNPTFASYTETRRVDTFAHFDSLLIIDPTGQCNVVF